MACLVSISFSMPLCSPRTLFKEIHPRKAALDRLSSQATTRRATNFLAHCSSSKGMCCVYQSHHLHLTAASKHFAESVSCRLVARPPELDIMIQL